MKEYKQKIIFQIVLLLILLALFFDARLFFFVFNKEHFQSYTPFQITYAFIQGLRFDIAAIFFTQALWVFLISFFIDLTFNSFIRTFAKFYFIFSSFVSLAFNYIDIAYFSFIEKRSSFDVFRLMGEQTDILVLAPVFLKEYWYLALIFLVNILLLWVFYTYFEKKYILSTQREIKGVKSAVLRLCSFALVILFSVLGMRGGLQLSPLSLAHAAESVEGPLIPLTLNSPFSIIKSYKLKGMRELNEMKQAEAETIFNPLKDYSSEKLPFKNKNIVLIILESFSLEYTGLSGKNSYTPFLDSLASTNLYFRNAFANGKRSIEGIPAILASIPSFEEPYVNSIYCGNKIESFASLLKKRGYQSSFYHGGKNGTMSFDAFCKVAAFDLYFGLNEYPQKKDYDGNWGIWDKPFLSHYATELSNHTEPFVSAIFTLSSHHPFQLPPDEENNYPKGPLPIHKTIRYTDDALRLFFKKASSQSWYSNTIFVITADHTGPSHDEIYSNSIGNYRIPLVFFSPTEKFPPLHNRVVQQIDILPSVLHYLNYDANFFSFGQSVFDTLVSPFAVNYNNNIYQFIDSHYIAQFNGVNLKSTFCWADDPLLTKIISPRTDSLQLKFRAFLQVYQNRIIQNKTSID